VIAVTEDRGRLPGRGDPLPPPISNPSVPKHVHRRGKASPASSCDERSLGATRRAHGKPPPALHFKDPNNPTDRTHQRNHDSRKGEASRSGDASVKQLSAIIGPTGGFSMCPPRRRGCAPDSLVEKRHRKNGSTNTHAVLGQFGSSSWRKLTYPDFAGQSPNAFPRLNVTAVDGAVSGL